MLHNSFINSLRLCFFVLLAQINVCVCQELNKQVIPLNNNNNSGVLKKVINFDKEGFLWYSTFNGLVKYTGKDHQLFKIKHPTEKEIHVIDDFVCTDDNFLIAVSGSGICVFNLKTNSQLWFNPKDIKGKSIRFNSVKKGLDNTIWLGTEDSFIFSYNTQTNELKKYKTELSGTEIKHIKNGILIVRSYEDFYSVKIKKSEFLDAKIFWKDINEEANVVIVSNGEVFPENLSGEYHYEGQKYKFKTIKELDVQVIETPFKYVYTAGAFNNDRIEDCYMFCLNAKGTLQQYNFYTENKNIILKKNERLKIHKVIHTAITPYNGVIYYDNTIWAITENGLESLKLSNFLFSNYLADNKFPIGCRTIEEFEDSIIIFTYDGFYQKNKKNGSLKKLDFRDKLTNEIPNYLKDLYGFLKINDSLIIGYGFYSSLFKLNITSNKTEEFKIQTHLNKENTFFSDVIKLNSEELLVSSNYGLYKFNIGSRKFSNVSKISGQVDLKDTKISCLLYDKELNNLWVGTESNGVYRKNIRSGKVVHYFHQHNFLRNLTVNDIYKDTEGKIWLGTTNGLIVFTNDLQKIVKYGVSEGLKDTNITKIKESNDALWFGTYKGLGRICKKSKEIHFFDKKDGLSFNEFNRKSALKAKDNKMYFGGVNGFISFNPNKIIISKSTPKLFLTKVNRYDVRQSKDTIVKSNLENLKTIVLPTFQNYVSLEFALAYLKEAKENQYFYKLNENQWLSLKNSNMINLQGLGSGDHFLKVKAVTNRGIESNVLNYKIIVEKVFYKKTWFLISIFLIVLGLVVYVQQAKRKRLVELHEKKLKELNLQSKLSLNLMSSHFINNILTGLQVSVLMDDDFEINKHFDNYSNILRQTLNMCNREDVKLYDEIEYIKNYVQLENSILYPPVDLEINISNNINLQKIKIPTMMLQPIIENSIHHGLLQKNKNRKIIMSFKINSDILICSIQDNGVGRKAASTLSENQQTSWGTKIIKNRMEISSILGKEMSFEIFDLEFENEPIGTKVVLKMTL